MNCGRVYTQRPNYLFAFYRVPEQWENMQVANKSQSQLFLNRSNGPHTVLLHSRCGKLGHAPIPPLRPPLTILAQFPGCIDPPGRCMPLQLFRVHSAHGTCCMAPKNGFCAAAGWTLQHNFIKLYEKADTIGCYVFFYALVCGS